MSYQQINLGTPNNNDGDSLYAGGVKINANFLEIYNAIAGGSSSAIKINLGTPVTSTALFWSVASQQFVPASSDAIRTMGAIGTSAFFITNNAGTAGQADQDLSSVANTAVLQIDGRSMLFLRARNNTSFGTTRGSLDINVGNPSVTSLSVYTTGVVVRGINGFEIYRAAGEESASYTKLLDSTSTATGVTLYQTPVLDFNTMSSGVRNGSDSSNAVAHTGFIKYLLNFFAPTSTTVRGVRGIIATSSDLTQGVTFNVDGIYHPKHIEGLIYNYNTINNVITLVTGAACHWSYNTSGVAGLLPTSAIAIVASYTPILRSFTSGWTPDYNDAGSTPAVIDSTIAQNTWYYLYYIGCLQQYTTPAGRTFYPGSSNVVVSSNRDIASVDAQLRAAGYGPAGPNGYWQVVRRLGPVRSDGQATPRLIPFNVKRIDHGGFEYYWGLQPNSDGDTSYTTTINAAPLLKQYGSNVSFTLADYNSSLLTAIPPIPGITAHLTVRHQPNGAAAAPLPEIRMYGDAWTVNSSISALYPPFETIRSTVSGLVNVHSVQLPMSPDGCYIPDGTYFGAGILSVLPSNGQTIRYVMVRPQHEGMKQSLTSTLLQFTVTGFRLAR